MRLQQEKPYLDQITEQEKVAYLSRRASYPETTGMVKTLETHMSWVFLTDRYAWKMKKEVCFEGLDFSTVRKRQYYCMEEIRLNRFFSEAAKTDIAPDEYIQLFSTKVRQSRDTFSYARPRFMAHLALELTTVLETALASETLCGQLAERVEKSILWTAMGICGRNTSS
ncbi:hypothetical protein [Emcibacter sp.]|uniref:hypothetical protein n=1 Tax=Emcibacter sp. TaxID=1979954 RepID=UPI002AA6B608|nr:hypothetical protein [Emcibacter sp.]